MRVVLTDKERARMRKELRHLRPEPMQLRAGHDTICNHLRWLHQTGLTDEQNELCEEIIFLAKKITKRLVELKKNLGKGD